MSTIYTQVCVNLWKTVKLWGPPNSPRSFSLEPLGGQGDCSEYSSYTLVQWHVLAQYGTGIPVLTCWWMEYKLKHLKTANSVEEVESPPLPWRHVVSQVSVLVVAEVGLEFGQSGVHPELCTGLHGVVFVVLPASQIITTWLDNGIFTVYIYSPNNQTDESSIYSRENTVSIECQHFSQKTYF